MDDQRSAAAQAAPPPPQIGSRLRLGVLSNPLSTRNRKGMAKLREMLSRHADIPHVEIAEWDGLGAAIGQLMSKDLDVLVINGGDGTVVGLLTELRRRAYSAPIPALIVLASGNTNMIARDIGPADTPVRALSRLLSGITTARELRRAERRLIRIDQEGEPARFGFFVGAVAIVRAMVLARHTLHPIGVDRGLGDVAAMGLGVLQVLFGRADWLFCGVPVEVGFDDEPIRCGTYSVVMASTLDRLLFGARPFWGMGAGPIRATLVPAPVDRPLLSILPLMRGRPTERMIGSGYVSRNFQRITLAFDGPFAIDGEIRQASRERPLRLSDGGTVEFLSF
ncbi:MAG TPA: diacylglycerol kinase family protein [Alphaproteobacteria bacterium]|nr:diacylglycerol kinase family protein [Alphaproteobacteria bacterium]